eukprot:jgi/Tetstr1/429814/TSEL_019681.t1
MATELPRFLAIRAWERVRCNKWVSRMFLVPKPGTNKWRLIIDLRELNKWCKTLKMSYEKLNHYLLHLARAGDWFVSMDLADGYYALGIREKGREFFTVNYRGELWRLACLHMGWTGSSYYFCKLTTAFTDGHEARPILTPLEPALELRVRPTLLDPLGLLRNPNKGVWEPTQVGPHLGLIVDLQRGEFRAPEEKLLALAKAARSLSARHMASCREGSLRGPRVLLHADNTAVVAALLNLTSRSPVIMEEFRKLWHLLDIHNIFIMPRGMRTFATFREQEGLRPLQATTSTIVHNTWLDLLGTVGAESLQQYFSFINKCFRDH